MINKITQTVNMQDSILNVTSFVYYKLVDKSESKSFPSLLFFAF